MDEYLLANRAMWDDRAPVHAASRDYGVDRYVADPAHLSDVVRFDRERLGDVSGLRTVHLQCHIGTDTLSLHRLGARVTGLDLSPASLAEARRLAAAAGAAIEYVESDVYSATSVLPAGAFDLVYTGVGALCWLPDIDRWAAVVADLLAPGGRLFLRDGHPMLGTIELVDGRTELLYPYFHQEQAMVFADTTTYVEADRPLAGLPSHEWAHGLGEIVTALLARGLQLTSLVEHDSVPWDALPGLMADHPDHPGEHRLADGPERLAASFTLTAVKPS